MSRVVAPKHDAAKAAVQAAEARVAEVSGAVLVLSQSVVVQLQFCCKSAHLLH
jgi:hypothetical protein